MSLLSRLKRLWQISEEPKPFTFYGNNIKVTDGVSFDKEQTANRMDEFVHGTPEEKSKMAVVVNMNDPLDEFPNEEEV